MASIPANSARLRPGPDDDREQRLNELIAAYLEDLEAGRSPDRSGLLERHPELAADLACFFANQDHLDRLTAPLRVRSATEEPLTSVIPFPAQLVDTADDPGSRAQNVRYFGDYELLEIIAEGGMGVVYKARQVSLDRVLALKMVRAGRFATPDDLHRFRLEAEAAAHLDHPHIVPIHEIGEYEGHHYFSMKLVDGGNLAAHAGRFTDDPRATAKLMATVARAVHYAHQRGILHRDLKPANILLSGRAELPLVNWSPMVTDFGLAKRFGGPTAAGVTRSGSLVGTPGYMAPEQAEGSREAITTAVDVHALGVILFELLTGRPPFRAETLLETLRMVREQEPARPRSLNPRVPRDLATIALKCLNKAPSRRYHSAEALAEDLERWLDDVPIRARRSTISEHMVKWARRRPWVAALMVVGGVAVASSAMAVRGLISSAELRTVLDRTRGETLRMEADQYFHGVLAAEQALASHNPDQAGRLLEECPARLRNWEWRHLMRRRHSELRVLQGHSGFVCGSDFAASSDRVLRCTVDVLPDSLWGPSPNLLQPFLLEPDGDSASGPARYRIHGPDGSAYGLTFDRQGIRVATAGSDGVVKVWNVVTGAMTHLFRGHDGWAAGVSFSPDGTRLASAGKDGMIRVWDVGSDPANDRARPLKTFIGHDGPVFGVAFSPDGAKLVSAGADGTVRIWEPARSAEDPILVIKGHDRDVISVAFHPAGDRVASGGADRQVRIWDLATGRERSAFQAGSARINALAFSPDGERLAVGGLDHSVTIWDVATHQPIVDYPGHAQSVLYVGFSPDGGVLASASQDATIKLWDARSEPGVLQFRIESASGDEGHGTARPGPSPKSSPRWVGGVAFAPSGGELAAAGSHAMVALWDATTGRLRCTLPGGWGTMIGIAYDPTGYRLAAASSDRTVRIWELRSVGEPIMLAELSEGIASLSFRPDGRLLATGGGDPPEVVQGPRGKFPQADGDGRTIRIWDPATGREIRGLRGHVGSVYSVAFSPDGTRLASAGADRTVRIWDPATGDLLSALEGHTEAVFAVAFSPDGARLASAGADRSIRIWDPDSGRPILTLNNHKNWVMGLAFSPDGSRLASAGADQTVRIWDPVRGREVLTLRGPSDRVHGVAFSPDGHSLAAASADGTVRVWEARQP
jgi:eukaryotic-like serine/threonine-protein kinase